MKWTPYILAVLGVVLVALAVIHKTEFQPAQPTQVEPVQQVLVPLVRSVQKAEASTTVVVQKVFAKSTSKILPKKSLSVVYSDPRLPVRIIIPAIKVNAFVEKVGLKSDGEVDVPKNPIDAAWFDQSPIPGDIGNAVIDGHYGWKNNMPVVFDSLHALKIGDKIYIDNGSGATTIFVVDKVVIYSEHDSATNVFESTDGKAHLNIITCGGVWNRLTKSYSDRIVVFSDLATI